MLNAAWATWSTETYLGYPRILPSGTSGRMLDVEGKEGLPQSPSPPAASLILSLLMFASCTGSFLPLQTHLLPWLCPTLNVLFLEEEKGQSGEQSVLCSSEPRPGARPVGASDPPFTNLEARHRHSNFVPPKKSDRTMH